MIGKRFETTVDESGRLVLPDSLMMEYGLVPGTKIRLEGNGNGVHLRRPVTQLARVYIEPTNRCNLDCVTCIRHSWHEPMGEMRSEVFSRIVEGLKAFSLKPSVFFGGLGEPLAHPHIVDMVSQMKALGCSVELITNATLLTKSLSKQLIDAGLDVLWVSLDGSTPESYKDVRLGGALPEVISNLQEFRKARWAKQNELGGLELLLQPQLGVEFVAMKRNIDDLPNVLSLACNLGAIHFLVTNFQPTRLKCRTRSYTHEPYTIQSTHRHRSSGLSIFRKWMSVRLLVKLFIVRCAAIITCPYQERIFRSETISVPS